MSTQPANSLLFLVRGYTPASGSRVSGWLAGPAHDLTQWKAYFPRAYEIRATLTTGYSAPDAVAVTAQFGGINTPESPLYKYDSTAINFALPRNYSVQAPPIAITLPPSGRVFGDAFGAVPLIGGVTARHGVRAVASGAVPLAGGALAETENTAAIGNAAGAVPLAGAATARHGVRATADGHLPITLSGSATARHGVRAVLSGSVPLAGGAAARHGVRGVAAGGVSLGGSVASTHVRYEVRGEVRLTEGGLLVQRRVRVYSRETGALVGQGDSVGGYFQVPCDLAPAEYVILPIDLSESATDFAPPVANRVTSVLARDDWR